MKRFFGWALCVLIGASAAACQAADELLTVGSKAPELNIEHWLKNGGNFKPVTKFQPGKIYVVEFWATWCGPCIQGMPHLAQLQKEYAEKGVQIIGVSSEDLETVQEFLARQIPKGDAESDALPATFGELTSAYSLTCDPDESTDKAYMQAANQMAIPNAFIVGKEGKIEWIGHPGEMDDVLRQVVAGTWDRTEYGKRFLAMQKLELAKAELNEALRKRDFAKAIELIDAQIEATDDVQSKLELRLTKVQIALVENKVDVATKRLQECYDAAKGQTGMIDLISWHIYEQSEQRQMNLAPLVKVAYAESEKALGEAKGEARGSLLDTVAHLAYKQGDIDKAIKLVREATELARGENKEFSKQFLEQLLKEKAESEKASDSAAPKKAASDK
ncbi:MAG: redoxin domain-containing protein [Aureliella sp.]